MHKSPVNQLFDLQWNSGWNCVHRWLTINCQRETLRAWHDSSQPNTDLLIHLLQKNVEMKHKWIEIEKYCPNLQFSQSINWSSWILSANISNIACIWYPSGFKQIVVPKICKLSHLEEGSVKWCSSLVLEAQPPSSTNCNHFKILQFSKWWFLFIKRKH